MLSKQYSVIHDSGQPSLLGLTASGYSSYPASLSACVVLKTRHLPAVQWTMQDVIASGEKKRDKEDILTS